MGFSGRNWGWRDRETKVRTLRIMHFSGPVFLPVNSSDTFPGMLRSKLYPPPSLLVSGIRIKRRLLLSDLSAFLHPSSLPRGDRSEMRTLGKKLWCQDSPHLGLMAWLCELGLLSPFLRLLG